MEFDPSCRKNNLQQLLFQFFFSKLDLKKDINDFLTDLAGKPIYIYIYIMYENGFWDRETEKYVLNILRFYTFLFIKSRSTIFLSHFFFTSFDWTISRLSPTLGNAFCSPCSMILADSDQIISLIRKARFSSAKKICNLFKI